MVTTLSERFLRGWAVGLCFCGLFAAPGRTQEIPDFDLSIEAPASLEAEAHTTIRFEAVVYLESHVEDQDQTVGAQGWTLSIATPPKAHVESATTEGTVGDDPPVGLFSQGFQLTTVTEGEGNLGAVSAVALSFFEPITLSPNGKEALLRLSLTAQVPGPEEGCLPVTLEFKDGLRGPGQPVRNTITFLGQTRKDDGSAKDGDPDREEDAVVWVCPPIVFLRGDCSPDSKVDLSDPILALGYLFLGEAVPPCLLACDSNDDDVVDIADAIYTLQHLFLGGAVIPPPYPDCGKETTYGPLSCAVTDC
jgi:hypothetical protein